MALPATCPRCRRPAEPGHFPFCSQRCRLLDLGAWLSGERGIPIAEDEEGRAAAGEEGGEGGEEGEG